MLTKGSPLTKRAAELEGGSSGLLALGFTPSFTRQGRAAANQAPGTDALLFSLRSGDENGALVEFQSFFQPEKGSLALPIAPARPSRGPAMWK